jgi:metal-responsive CopG/Arc/MetJ family transcriptional regulator
MRTSVNLTLDSNLLKEIDRLRAREKRSTFVEHLIRLGLRARQRGET